MNEGTTRKLKIRFLLVVAGLGGLLYGVDFGVIAASLAKHKPLVKSL